MTTSTFRFSLLRGGKSMRGDCVQVTDHHAGSPTFLHVPVNQVEAFVAGLRAAVPPVPSTAYPYNRARELYAAEIAVLGITPCGDSCCILAPPGGMRTNGGCSCLEDVGDERMRPEHRVYVRKLIAAAIKALAGLL